MNLLAVLLSVTIATTGAAPADNAVPTPPAHPSEADQERAKEIFDNGYKLFQEGSYDGAISAFRAAYSMSGDPTLLYNIALACERAGEYDLALDYLQAYRVYAPPEEWDKLAEKAESFRKRKLNAALEVQRSEPASAGASSDLPEQRGEPIDRQPEPSREIRVFGPAAAVLTAVAGASFATALGLGLAARARNQDAEGKCMSGAAGRLCSEDADADLRGSRKLALGTDIMIGVGAASVLALVVVLATNGVRRNRQRRQQVAVLPSPGGAGLGWRF
jgi:tetratricopeptide (TPR) repeat protein